MNPLLAIFIWPVVSVYFYRQLNVAMAFGVTIIGGYLLLPAVVNLDLPVLPPLNKHTIPSFVALVAIYVISRRNGVAETVTTSNGLYNIEPGWLPRHPLVKYLFLLLIVGALTTGLTNGDTLRYGSTTIQGLTAYDAFSQVLAAIVAFLPLLLARKVCATSEQHKTLLICLSVGALIYSFPAFWEIRMSPQLNNQIYGFANGWKQHVRGGGFRPLVFLQHSLWLGIFTSGAVVATFGLLKVVDTTARSKVLIAGLWLFALLFLSRTLGAFAIALLLIPVAVFMGTRGQMLFAACVAAVILVYPTLRGAGLVPIDGAVSVAESINVDRAHSLEFRLRNEDILLAKANERPFAGWGSWGRNRVYDENGHDVSVTDGQWVIEIGSNGWIGYLSRFGLMTAPVIILGLRRRKYSLAPATSILALVLVGNLIDLIPNATLTPITMILAGALVGHLDYQLRRSSMPEVKESEQLVLEEDDKATRQRTSNYTRQTEIKHR